MTQDIERLFELSGVPTTIGVGATIRAATAETAHASLPPVDASWSRQLPHLSLERAPSSTKDGTRPDAPDLRVVATLGEGGMGRVMLARQHSLQREVAIKVARAGLDGRAAANIIAEGVVCGQLEHPGIVPVHMLGLDDAKQPVIVMKRIEGVSWDVLLRDPSHPGWEGWEGDPSDRLAGHLQILRAVSNALHFAHARGIVHRDVKPENVLIGRFGDVYLADWGIATPLGTKPAHISGTAGYMAPEMALCAVVDARTDVYLLGATLHEVLVGRMRHEAPTAMAAVVSALESAPYDYPDAVPAELAALANRACHVDPDQRPTDARAFERAIAAFGAHRDSIAVAERAEERLDRIEAASARDDLDEDARRELDRWVVEASFGVEAALAQWSENPVARRSSVRLEALLDARRARQEQLERQARQFDPAIDRRPRAIAMTLFGIQACASTAVALLYTPAEVGIVELLGFPLATLAIVTLGTLALRRTALATQFNRQLVACVFVTMAVLLVSRFAGVAAGTPLTTILTVELFFMAAAMGVVGAVLLRWCLALAGALLVAGSLVQFFPDQALPIYALSISGTTGLAVVLVWLIRPQRAT